MVRAETAAIRERFVSWVWANQLLTDQLQTSDGRHLQVVYPGRGWGEGQPDFQGAMIAWERGPLERGDVEIHVRQRDWVSHGHHGDPRYDGVILHVALRAARPHETVNSHGDTVPTLLLEPFLRRPLATLLAEWSRDQALQVLPCETDPTRAAEILDAAGLERFHWKAAQIEGDLCVSSPTDLLWRGTARALGYTANADTMTRLAEHLPFSTLNDALATMRTLPVGLTAYGALLGVSGLLLDPEEPECSTLERGLQSVWRSLEAQGVESLASLTFEMRRVRPANHPVRRIAALAQYAERWRERDVLGVFGEQILSPSYRPAILTRAMIVDTVPEQITEHLDSWRMARCPHETLVGRDRAAEIVINAVLPELYALGSFWGLNELAQAAEQAFLTFPLATRSGLSQHMATQLFGAAGRPLITTACRQQGLIHLYRTACRDHQCDRCPAGFSAQRIPLPRMSAPLQLGESPPIVGSDAGVFHYR